MRSLAQRFHDELSFWNNLLLLPITTMVLIGLFQHGFSGLFQETPAAEMISVAFFLEWLLGLLLASDRRAYFVDPERFFDLLSSLPLGILFQGVRFLRVVRILRLARIWIRARHLGSQFSALGRAGLVVATIAVTGAFALQEVEPEVVPRFSDALWWSIVTISTVGYGDIFPHSDAGRVIGSILIMCGVGSFGYVAGFMTTAFASQPNAPAVDPVQDGFRRLEEQIQQLREEVRRASERGSTP